MYTNYIYEGIIYSFPVRENERVMLALRTQIARKEVDLCNVSPQNLERLVGAVLRDHLIQDQVLLENSHMLDAVVCVLAGADFLRGQCFRPKNLLSSKKEGWIWVREPELKPACNPVDRADGKQRRRSST
jgi:hypothetical protein